MTDSPVRVFIGSSSEHLHAARYLQSELEKLASCEATCWDQDIFELSSYSLDSLIRATSENDFAVLLATPDDTTTRRGDTATSPRDNVIFELGLFMGALGRERTFLVADRTDKNLQLPSDVAGLTYAAFKPRVDGNIRAALNDPVLAIANRVKALGSLRRSAPAPGGRSRHTQALEVELESVCRSADAQGWTVKKRSSTTLRLQDRKGGRHTLSLGTAEKSRIELREFARELRRHGLRVNRSVRQPMDESRLV